MLKPETTPPGELIARLIAESPDGAVGFRQYMEWALYHPEAGYYASGCAAPGREGDFYTSASVGGCFGRILACHAGEIWEQMGRPDRFDLVEQGANDGRLASDLLEGLEEECPKLRESVRLRLIEPVARLRERQARHLPPDLDVEWVEEVGELPAGTSGLFFANELLDAFPVDLVRWNGTRQRWEEVRVGEKEGRPVWAEACEPGDSLAEEIRRSLSPLGTDWPDGYETELHGPVLDWARALCSSPFQGGVLLLDYGLSTFDYRHPSRSAGTLKRIRDHQNSDDLLADAGESDLTAHVDWSRLADVFREEAWPLAGFCDQGGFLTRTAEPWLRNREERGAVDSKVMRQFQTLVHPGLLGRSFQAIGFWSRRLEGMAAPRGFHGRTAAPE